MGASDDRSSHDTDAADPRSLRLPRAALTADPGFWEAARLQRAAVFQGARREPAHRAARERITRPPTAIDRLEKPAGYRGALQRLRSWLARAPA
jgi:hypothetical protein